MTIQRTKYVGYGDDSQMYVYRKEAEGEPFVCCFCLLHDGESFRTTSPAEMGDHIDQHKAAGLRTPDWLAGEFRAMTA